MKEMAEETSKEKETVESSEKKETGPVKKKQKGFISRVFNGLFRIRGDDFEKRLQYISKEEATVMTRLKIRSQNWRSRARNLILVSVLAEAIAISYAIMTTRSLDLDWKMRAIRVLPMFLLPALSSFAYMSLMKIMKICDNKDQKTLERLRAERQAKIDELKERTNYYSTQQLIQRYDPDPAAKAAAATVLASKLGADSGLKLYMQDDSMINATSGKSNDVEYAQSGGLRNRKQAHVRSNSAGSNGLQLSDKDMVRETGISPGIPEENNQPMVVEHFQHQGSVPHDGGWIARIAALLVGEDPTQSYALICGNCHMHNGLVRKEDFPFVTYFCPHCRALNRSNKSEEGISGSMSLDTGLMRTQGSVDAISRDPLADVTPTNSSRPSSPPLIEEISDGAVAGEIIKKAN